MRRSPIQLLQTTLMKVAVEPVQDDGFATRGQPSPFEYDHIVLETARSCTKFPEFWDGTKEPVEGVAARTYVMHLGLRTSQDGKPVGPYVFEIVASGVVAVMPSRQQGKVSDENLAFQYGLTMLYGVIREQLGALTRRMPWGEVLLPTMSFLDEKSVPPAIATEPSQPELAPAGENPNHSAE